MRFECELKGDIEEILANIERTVMIESEEASDSCTDNERIVVRSYNSGVGFTLSKIGDNISIIVTGKEDSLFGGNIYFELIKDAVEDYRDGGHEKIDTLPYFVSGDGDNTISTIVENYDKADVVVETAGTEKNNIESAAPENTGAEYSEEKNTVEDTGIDDIDAEDSMEESDAVGTSEAGNYTYTAKNTVEDIADKTSIKAVNLVCQCDYEFEKELYKSTFENISEDMWYPLSYDSERDYYMILNNWWRKNKYVNKIAKKAESIVKIAGYDYITMVRGLFCLLAGIIVGVAIPWKIGGSFYLTYDAIILCFKFFMFYQAFRGFMYVVPYTQQSFRIFEWRCGKRFMFENKSPIAGSNYSPDGIWNFENTNEVVLNSECIQFYYKTGIRSISYKDCASIFETDNLFIIMIQSNYIASFPKCGMTSKHQTAVRVWLSPYYKTDKKVSEC